MDLKGACSKHFADAIKTAPVSQELKRAAVKHHNFKQFQDKLYKQVLDVEILRSRQRKPKLKPNTVKDLIYAFVHTYLAGVEGEAMKRAESDIAKYTRELAEQKQKDLGTSLTTGNLTGEYEEYKGEVILTGVTTR